MKFGKVSKNPPKYVSRVSSLDFIGEDDKGLIKYLQLLYNSSNISPSKNAPIEKSRSEVCYFKFFLIFIRFWKE
jgi:hypothetical protein